MSLNRIISEFQNYTINKTDLISNYLSTLKNNNTIDESDLKIREYLLNEVLLLTNKALLNKFSADVLFQNNYWSWGIVTTYYSNFFLIQALNRLKGNFFTFVRAYGNGTGRGGRRYIYLDQLDGNFKLISCPSNYTDSHGGEIKKFKENYDFLLLDSTQNNRYIVGLANNYKESQIRNDVNYKLEHYKELNNSSFKIGLNFDDCKNIYDNYNTLSITSIQQELKMIVINKSRFELLFYILNEVKKTNNLFEIEYNELTEKIKKQITYGTKNEILKYLINRYNSNIKFHPVSEMLKLELEGLIK